MRVTIIPSDGVVLIDGSAIHIDCSDMPANIHAVQFSNGQGHVEYTDGPNRPITSVDEFQTWIDRWEAKREEEDAPPPPPTPEQIKAEAIRQIDTQRDEALNAGFTHNGQLFHCDPTFQSQVQAFLLAWQVGMLPPQATVNIRRHDNVTVQLNQAEVAALAGALMAHVQGIYAASWAAKDAL